MSEWRRNGEEISVESNLRHMDLLKILILQRLVRLDESEFSKSKRLLILEGNNMSVIDVLKPHNLEAFKEINEMIESGIKKIAVPRATGSGKTYLMGALAEKYNDDLKLVLEPSNPLLGEIKDKFEEFGINNTDFITYQKLIRMSDEDIAQMEYKLIFLDESHHGTAPVWGKKIDYLMSTHAESIVLGTSATIIRSDGVNIVQTLFEGNAIEELLLSTAVARKVLPCPHYIAAIYRLDDELDKLKKKVENSTNTKKEKKEFLKKMQEMKMHFEKSYGIPLILNKYIKEKDGRYLVFCKDKKHLDTMRNIVVDWFKVAGIKNIHDYAVYSDYPDKEKDYKAFCEDKSNSSKILFAIDMLNEGIHIKNISGVIMLRTTLSNIIYLQQLGRLVEAENIGKYLLVFDFVNNFSSANEGVGLLKEIKNAIAREKESDPNFDDSGLEDIDTFFVLEQVMEIKEMFAQIEGRLEGSWDLYIKALKQYKERVGDCDVPKKHVEVVDGVGVKLGYWCINIRSVKKEQSNYSLANERLKQLDEIGFIWDVPKYRFENNVKAVAEYYKKYGEYPSYPPKDSDMKQLLHFISNEKMNIHNRDFTYPEWKKEILDKYLPDFSCETRSDKSFNEFVYYAKLYKERYGHLNIQCRDIIDGYNVGRKRGTLSCCKALSENQKKELEDLGIYLGNKLEKQFDDKMELSKQAVKDGVIIGSLNRKYRSTNLYEWVTTTVKDRYKKGNLSQEEMQVIEKLIGKSLDSLYCGKSEPIKVKVVDIIENREVGIFESQSETERKMREKYDIKINSSVIRNHLTGKFTTPYENRFMFYRVDDDGEVTE